MNKKKFIAGVLACCAVGGIIPSAVYRIPCAVTANAEDEAEYTERTYGQLTYKHYGDHIEISKCDETATEVEIPAEIDSVPVTSIGCSAFSYCTSLTSIEIPDSVTSIRDSAFYGCEMTSITIPDSVTNIEDFAFNSCFDLKSVTIPNGVTSIGGFTFTSCKALISVTIPNSITSIGPATFEDCTSLTSIEIPDSVTSIEGWAFNGCSALTSITILNPKCEIYDIYSSYDNGSTISNGYDEETGSYFNGTIYGYENSTAQAYAEKYDYKFIALDKAPETPSEITGDANGDNTVDLADAVSIIQHIGNENKYALSEQGIINADCNGDGKITGADALAIQKLEAGLIDSLPYIE